MDCFFYFYLFPFRYSVLIEITCFLHLDICCFVNFLLLQLHCCKSDMNRTTSLLTALSKHPGQIYNEENHWKIMGKKQLELSRIEKEKVRQKNKSKHLRKKTKNNELNIYRMNQEKKKTKTLFKFWHLFTFVALIFIFLYNLWWTHLSMCCV